MNHPAVWAVPLGTRYCRAKRTKTCENPVPVPEGPLPAMLEMSKTSLAHQPLVGAMPWPTVVAPPQNGLAAELAYMTSLTYPSVAKLVLAPR